MVSDNLIRKFNVDKMRELREEKEQTTTGESKVNREVNCHWCNTTFMPADAGDGYGSINRVYLGGHGMVWGCDSCLGLQPVGAGR